MSLYTEDEARTKLCPFSLLGSDARQFVASSPRLNALVWLPPTYRPPMIEWSSANQG